MNETLDQVLEGLYASEINAQIRWCWDGGFDVSIGNASVCGMNAKPEAEATFETIAAVKAWLVEAAKELYPESQFAKERKAK